jgi:hypothetical protein
MGAMQNLSGETCVFAVIESIFLGSLHTQRTWNGSVTARAPYSPTPAYFSIGKAVNTQEREFGSRY